MFFQVNVSKSLSRKEKEFKLHVLEMFLEELRESEKDMLNAQEGKNGKNRKRNEVRHGKVWPKIENH